MITLINQSTINDVTEGVAFRNGNGHSSTSVRRKSLLTIAFRSTTCIPVALSKNIRFYKESICIFVYMHIYSYHVYIYMHIYAFIYMYIYIYINIYNIYIYVYMYIYLFVEQIYPYSYLICAYAFICIYMFVLWKPNINKWRMYVWYIHVWV